MHAKSTPQGASPQGPGQDVAQSQRGVALYDMLTPERRAEADRIMASVDIGDPQEALQFGLPAQDRIAGFADSLLADLRNKDAGYVGDALAALVTQVKELDVGSLGGGDSALRKLPLVGRFLDSFGRFVARYEKVSANLERILTALERARMELLKDITLLEKMYELNLDYLDQLDLYIAAGTELLRDLRSRRLPELEEEARASDDALAGQRLADFQQSLVRFERRVHDLGLTRLISIQTAPQVRLIQDADNGLVEKIQSSIMTTVPLWKNQIVIAIALYRQQRALQLQKEVSATTSELLARNAEMLRKGSVEAAQEAERGVVDLETLKQVNDRLIATLEETLSIQAAARERREHVAAELATLEGELKAKLVDLRSG